MAVAAFTAVLLWTGGRLPVGAQTQADATIAPTDADRAAFLRGELSQRYINILQDPRMCGIVLLRATCAAALLGDTETGFAGVQRFSRFAHTGDRDAYDPLWADANAILPPQESRWATDARATWLEAAGVVYQVSFYPASLRTLIDLFEIPTLEAMTAHAAGAGPYSALIPPALATPPAPPAKSSPAPGHKGYTATQLGDSQLAHAGKLMQALVPELAAVFPPSADPFVRNVAGPRGDMLRGVYMSSGTEMFESPLLFLSPQSRSFLRDVCNAMAEQTPDSNGAAQARALGERFLQASGDPTAWLDLQKQWREELPRWTIFSLPIKRRALVIYGTYAAQSAYNAAMLRQNGWAVETAKTFQNVAVADEDLPDIKVLRERLLAASPTDWKAVNAAATALTLAIAAP